MRLCSRLCCKCDSWVRLSCSPREHVWLLFRMKARTSQDSEIWEVVQGTVEFSYFRFGQNIRWFAGSSSKKSWLNQTWLTEIKFDELLIDSKPKTERNEMWINYWNKEQQNEFYNALYSDVAPNFALLSNINFKFLILVFIMKFIARKINNLGGLNKIEIETVKALYTKRKSFTNSNKFTKEEDMVNYLSVELLIFL